jgi:hypothetical protein
MCEENNVVCPFCNAKWTGEMVKELYKSAEGCESCGFGEEYTYTIEIKCEACGKVIYRKEGKKT